MKHDCLSSSQYQNKRDIFGYFPPEHDTHNFDQYLKQYPRSKYVRHSYSADTNNVRGKVKLKLTLLYIALISIPVTVGILLA